MIRFVLDHAGREVIELHLELFAIQVEGADDDVLGPADRAVEFGDAEAPLFAFGASLPPDDLGIDEDELLVLLSRLARDIDDK